MYLEKLVSEQCSGGDAGHVIPSVCGAGRYDGIRQVQRQGAPTSFIRHELGFAIESGPSIEWTMKTLEDTNRRHRRMLAETERPVVLQKVREAKRRKSAADYGRKFERALASVGVKLRAA